MAHTAAMNTTWERGCPARATAPRAGRRPPPGPSPTGGGNPAPPPSGGRLGGGVHAAHDGHRSRPCGSAAPRRDETRFFLGGRSPPKPSQGPGPGCAGLRPASAGVWGNRVSPHPSSRAYIHLSPPCGSAAHRRNEHTVVSGRATPSQTLPRAGAWGNPVSPHPSPRDYFHVRELRRRRAGRRGLPGPGGYGRIYLRAVHVCALQLLPAIVPSSIAQ